MQDILRVISASRFEKERPPATIKEYENSLGIKQYCANFYWFCDICKAVSQTSAFKKPYSIYCCGKKLDENSDHFILLDMKEQVSSAITGAKPRKSLSNEKRRVMIENYDYNDDDITITLNTDGAPLFTSSNSSLWPILGVIDNIAFTEQKRRMLLLGLWISKGSKKPNFEIFLNNFIQRIRLLHKEQIEWEDGEGILRKSRIFISRVMCDSIARPAVQMMNQFNAKYGCGYCYHLETGHYYSYYDIVLRSHEEHKNICEQAESDGRWTYGVTSKSPFLNLEYIDIIQGTYLNILI